MEVSKPAQFSLVTLFQLTLLAAILLGLWRLYERELQPGFEFHSLAYQTSILVAAGVSIGAFVGSIGGNRRRWMLAGCAIGVLIGAYLSWWFVMACVQC